MRIKYLPRHLFTVILLVSLRASAADPTVNGRIERIESLRVLRVWGTPREMGFAHGRLLGAELVRLLNEDLSRSGEKGRREYEEFRTQVGEVVTLSRAAREEIEGILEGVKAPDGSLPQVDAVKRPLTLEDLIVHNAADLIRAFGGSFGCSGFTVWGARAGEAGVITARNFDFEAFRGMVEAQLVLVRQPAAAGRHAVATITWPGYIGAFTGINDAGVCTFMHDGTGERLRTPEDKYTPMALVLTELLETSAAGEAHERAAALLKRATPYPFSYLVRVVTPRVAGKVERPERVFRVDASGLSENPAREAVCITTNHYLSAAFEPASNAGSWSRERYSRLQKRLDQAVTSQAAWEALASVASGSKEGGTLHSVVIYPERLRLELALAGWDDGLVPAPKRAQVSLEFKHMFAKAK